MRHLSGGGPRTPARPTSGRSACGPISAAKALIDGAAAELRTAGVEAPRREAELLLAHTLEVSAPELVAGLSGRAIDARQVESFQAAVERRAAREPFAYITGRKGFRRIELQVDPRVLIPRPESETVVEVVLAATPQRLLDVATGSGALALALADELPDCAVDAVDLSEDALEVARTNAQLLGLDARTRFWRSDLLDAVEDRYDCIVANLPYIPSAEIAGLQPEITDHEPLLALDGGEDGLQPHRRLIEQAQNHLSAGGLLALEIGDGQGPVAIDLLERAGFAEIDLALDLAQKQRVVSGRWR